MLWCPYIGAASFYQYCLNTHKNLKPKHPHANHRQDSSFRGELEMPKIATILLLSHYTATMTVKLC